MGGPRPFGRDAKYWWATAAIGLALVLGYLGIRLVWGMVTGGAA